MKKIYIKLGIACVFAYFLSTDMTAQEFRELDSSPHDIVYFRTNKISPPQIKVLYGRPKKNGREIYVSLLPAMMYCARMSHLFKKHLFPEFCKAYALSLLAKKTN